MVLVVSQEAAHWVQGLEVTREAEAGVRGQVLPPEAEVSQQPRGELGAQEPGEAASSLSGACNSSSLLQTVPDKNTTIINDSLDNRRVLLNLWNIVGNLGQESLSLMASMR